MSIISLVLLVVVLICLVVLLQMQSKHTADDEDPDRLDIKASRKSVPDKAFPEILFDYNLSNSADTGIFPTWNTDSTVLGSMCSAIWSGLQYAINHPKEKNADRAILIAENFMIKYLAQLIIVGVTPLKIPWGTNWYQFSVDSTVMLAHYLLLPKPALAKIASQIILILIDGPKKSLGYARDGANSVYITGPYLLAKNVIGEADQVFESKDYADVLQFLKLEVVRLPGADGLHLDKTFLFHSGVVSYTYLETLASNLTNYFYALDSKILGSPATVWTPIRSIIQHPTVAVAPLGLRGRRNDLTSNTAAAEYGIKVIPFQRYIRYYTKDHQFSTRGQTPELAYFEADKTNFTQAMYWTQYRTVHVSQSETNLRFPDAGFICDKSVTELIPVPSTTTTTTAFMPTTAESFVLSNSKYGVLWQKYSIEALGPQEITELIVINSKEKTITINLIIESSNPDTVYYSSLTKTSIAAYRGALTPIPVGLKGRFKTIFNLNDDTVQTTIVTADDALLPLRLDADTSVEIDSDAAVFLVKDLPKIICPLSMYYELDSLLHNDNIYKFDAVENQYIISN